MATCLGVLVTLNWPLVVLYGSVAGIGWVITRNSAIWWGIAALLLPFWSIALKLPFEIVWLCVAFVIIVALKRVFSNPISTRKPDRMALPSGKLLWNRIVFDRDVRDRQEWVYREPEK